MDPLDLNLYQLRVFQAVAQRLSFTRAAAALGRTQPAVSVQVRQLERRLGLDLFEHVGRKVHLTDAGRQLLVAVQRLMAGVDEVAQAVAELKGMRRGTLRVGGVSTAGEYVLPPLLRTFREAHPDIDVNLVVDNRAGILQRLYDNELDFAVMGRVPPAAALAEERILPNPLVVVAGPGHPSPGSAASRWPPCATRRGSSARRDRARGSPSSGTSTSWASGRASGSSSRATAPSSRR